MKLGIMFVICAMAIGAETKAPEPLKVWGNKLLATIDPVTGEVTLEKGVKQEEVTLAMLKHIEALAAQTAEREAAFKAALKTTKPVKDAPKKETPKNTVTK